MTSRKLMQIQDEDATIMANGQDVLNYSKAGTGKTLSALEAFKRAGMKRGLVLCPQIALAMWEQEIKAWLGASVKTLNRSGAVPTDTDFIVTTFDLARGGMRGELYTQFRDTDALILDEAHYLRRHTSKRTQAVFGVKCDGKGGLAEKFGQVWSLTGNPIYRHHDDLWSQLRYLYGAVLKEYGALSYEQFIKIFCVAKLKQHHPKMPPAMSIISSRNAPIINKILYDEIGAIRRMVANELPKKIETYLYPKVGAVPSEYAKLVHSMSEADLLKALIAEDGDEDHTMQQVWQAVTLAKVQGSIDYLTEIARDGPVLIGVWHSSVGEAYQTELRKAGYSCERVYGATPSRKREEIRDSFNAGNLDFIVGQMQAMGVSWNLQEASNRVVIAQDHFSPSIIEQFYKRVYRTGQERTTYVDFLVSQHPLDKAIIKLREQRERLQSIALDQH